MKKTPRAFTLVEVVLAIGILTFAMLPIVALMPLGLNVYRDAQVSSTEAEIIRQTDDVLQNSSYAALFGPSGAITSGSSLNRKYDFEGRDVTNSPPGGLPAVYQTTLTATNCLVNGSAQWSNGLQSPLNQTVAITVTVNNNRTDLFSSLVVNKGY